MNFSAHLFPNSISFVREGSSSSDTLQLNLTSKALSNGNSEQLVASTVRKPQFVSSTGGSYFVDVAEKGSTYLNSKNWDITITSLAVSS